MQKLVKGPVKLRKAGKAAAESNIRDGIIRGQKQGLCIADSCHLNIVRQSKARNPLKLMGQVIAADIKFPCDGFQGQVFRKMAVDICRDAVDLVGDAVEIQVVGVNILIPVKVNQA